MLAKKIRLFNIIIARMGSICLLFSITANPSLAAPQIKTPNAGIIYQNQPELPPYNLKPGQSIHITSGTGFFVSNDSIITNEHVVQGCQHIRIRGAVEPGYAELSAVDKINDLALLKTSRFPVTSAPLRGDMPVNIGETVSVMGYPLDRGLKGNYLIRKAVITSSSAEFDGIERTQFTDAVEKGNSGGPLLDTNGTVIGVIVGKMNFYKAGSDIEHSKPIQTSSVAITLKNLKKFLMKNNVYYRTDNTLYQFSDAYMENKAKDYIVNVQCVKDEEDNNEGDSAKQPQNQNHG